MAALRLNTTIFSPALFTRLRQVWFAGVPVDCVIAPPEANSRWFGFGTPDEKAQFDGVCRVEFASALDALAPARFAVPPAADWATERSHDAALAAPFLSLSLASDKAGEASSPLIVPGPSGQQVMGENGTVADAAAKTQDEAAKNALSLILLLDQIPRNTLRDDQALIYTHYDRLARAVVRSLLKDDDARQRPDLAPSIRRSLAFRTWFYLPLMHSEYLEDHARFAELMAGLREDLVGDEKATAEVERHLDFERRHLDILKKFGRYPHRNGHLGRETTTEERDFMEGGGDTFGVKTKQG